MEYYLFLHFLEFWEAFDSYVPFLTQSPSQSPRNLTPKKAIFGKKSHSFWKSDFSFEGFESQSLRYLVRLWQMLRYDEKIQSWFHGSYSQFLRKSKNSFSIFRFSAYFPLFENNANLIHPYRVDSIEEQIMPFNNIY